MIHFNLEAKSLHVIQKTRRNTNDLYTMIKKDILINWII